MSPSFIPVLAHAPTLLLFNVHFDTDRINANEMQLFYILYLVLKAVHVSDTLCVHHQEHYKLQ